MVNHRAHLAHCPSRVATMFMSSIIRMSLTGTACCTQVQVRTQHDIGPNWCCAFPDGRLTSQIAGDCRPADNFLWRSLPTQHILETIWADTRVSVVGHTRRLGCSRLPVALCRHLPQWTTTVDHCCRPWGMQATELVQLLARQLEPCGTSKVTTRWVTPPPHPPTTKGEWGCVSLYIMQA